jgi:23S rRNA pseudouridine2605 synthase
MIPRRLDKFLADATNMSRREIYRAWEEGRIEVRGAEAPWQGDYQAWSLVFEEDEVLLDGEPLELRRARHYFALHKPKGVLTTTSDPHGRRTLEPWLAELPPSVFPVGRLDRPTTGFLLLTDDGNLCYCLLRPWFGVQKEYHLKIRGHLQPGDERLQRLLDGIDIGDKKPPATALEVNILENEGPNSLVSVVVDEGRNRMVRRMARRAGLKLEHLHRPRIGPVRLGDVGRGEYRRLTKEEVDAMWQACGGRDNSEKRLVAALKRHAERWRSEGRPHLRLERWFASFE